MFSFYFQICQYLYLVDGHGGSSSDLRLGMFPLTFGAPHGFQHVSLHHAGN
jgi:hypothetical protein